MGLLFAISFYDIGFIFANAGKNSDYLSIYFHYFGVKTGSNFQRIRMNMNVNFAFREARLNKQCVNYRVVRGGFKLSLITYFY